LTWSTGLAPALGVGGDELSFARNHCLLFQLLVAVGPDNVVGIVGEILDPLERHHCLGWLDWIHIYGTVSIKAKDDHQTSTCGWTLAHYNCLDTVVGVNRGSVISIDIMMKFLLLL